MFGHHAYTTSLDPIIPEPYPDNIGIILAYHGNLVPVVFCPDIVDQVVRRIGCFDQNTMVD